jgi:hypothetical protein
VSSHLTSLSTSLLDGGVVDREKPGRRPGSPTRTANQRTRSNAPTRDGALDANATYEEFTLHRLHRL